MLFQNNFLWKKTVNYSGLMRNISNIDLKYVWRIPSMAWRSFYTNQAAAVRLMLTQHHQCDLVCPTYSQEAFKYAKATWSSLSARANRSKTLGYCFSNTQKNFFRRIICMQTCRCMRVFISCTYLCKFYVCSCVHCLWISSVVRVNTKEWLYTGRVDLLVVQISPQ